jgi:predicted HAD superfamily phosphohydrolase YqeG
MATQILFDTVFDRFGAANIFFNKVFMRDNVRVVIADVDGTLVTQDKALTTRAIDAVKRLRTADIAFTITSGRPPLRHEDVD